VIVAEDVLNVEELGFPGIDGQNGHLIHEKNEWD
jgi:hypothetical protein